MTGSRKPRTRTVPEDPHRWPPCVRCGHSYAHALRWPEGRICRYCYDAARQCEGTCAGCGHVGILPGLDAAGAPICVACSGVPLDVRCRRCGQEAPMGRAKICWRCQLADLLHTLLAGPDAAIPQPLRPLADALLAAARPSTGYAWIRRSTRAQQLLRDLAAGRVGLDHAAFDALPPSPTVEHVRGLLVARGGLPPRDINLAGFERWLTAKLDGIDDPARRQLIDRFARWHLLPDLRRRARHGAVPTGMFLNAKQSTTVAIGFLDWLADRGRTLADASQHDLDAWFATGPSTRKHARRLLAWARSHRITRGITAPRRVDADGDAVGQRHRLDQLRRLLDDDSLPVAGRLLAVLVLLFGQPVSKLVRLPRAAVSTDGDTLTLVLGVDPLPLPAPVAALLTTFLEDPRFRRTSAANHDSPWLFPGTRPGQPLHIASAYDLLHAVGVPPRVARTGTWQALVQHAPPSVLADALGAHPRTVHRYATAAGVDYARYPATPRRAVE